MYKGDKLHKIHIFLGIVNNGDGKIISPSSIRLKHSPFCQLMGNLVATPFKGNGLSSVEKLLESVPLMHSSFIFSLKIKIKVAKLKQWSRFNCEKNITGDNHLSLLTQFSVISLFPSKSECSASRRVPNSF
jgi:hypothetical protein